MGRARSLVGDTSSHFGTPQILAGQKPPCTGWSEGPGRAGPGGTLPGTEACSGFVGGLAAGQAPVALKAKYAGC